MEKCIVKFCRVATEFFLCINLKGCFFFKSIEVFWYDDCYTACVHDCTADKIILIVETAVFVNMLAVDNK